MAAQSYLFKFAPHVPLSEAEMTLHLAIFAAEGIHGAARVRLETAYRLRSQQNAIVVKGGTEVGASLVKVFTQLCIREFGEDAIQVSQSEATTGRAPVQSAPGSASGRFGRNRRRPAAAEGVRR